jgi:hypothetical protein
MFFSPWLSNDQLNTLAHTLEATQVIPTAVTSEHHELGNFRKSAQDASLFQIPSVNEELCYHVSNTIKTKIINYQFIDLA